MAKERLAHPSAEGAKGRSEQCCFKKLAVSRKAWKGVEGRDVRNVRLTPSFSLTTSILFRYSSSISSSVERASILPHCMSIITSPYSHFNSGENGYLLRMAPTVQPNFMSLAQRLPINSAEIRPLLIRQPLPDDKKRHFHILLPQNLEDFLR